ncbi:putative fluoride ion transporter CrcB [bacterium BMS3Abin04]|nr:putative fluoride ion transporter CrcB [bacterium BMS3Abin04]
MINILLVAFGAGIGGGFRYWVSDLSYKIFPIYFPYGTLVVNVLGSFLLGILIFGFDEKDLINPPLKLLLGVGFCGGFTTFSTFSFETINLLRDTQFYLAGMNIILNLFLGLLGIYLAYIITR